MFTATIDLGQIIIASCMAVIGFFIKWELARITARIDKHDDLLYQLTGEVRELLGSNRRTHLQYPPPYRRRVEDAQ